VTRSGERGRSRRRAAALRRLLRIGATAALLLEAAPAVASDTYFSEVVIGPSGYLVGQADDRFFVSGDFLSASTQNTSWSTAEAYLEFRTGADALHDFQLTGANRGPRAFGYRDNFAWGTLHLAPGNSLTLQDGNATPGGALYLKQITGLALSGSSVTNVTGAAGLDLYYLPNEAGNVYLGGASYDLTGGGQLVPVATPAVPASSRLQRLSLALLLLGAAAGRRRCPRRRAALV